MYRQKKTATSRVTSNIPAGDVKDHVEVAEVHIQISSHARNIGGGILRWPTMWHFLTQMTSCFC